MTFSIVARDPATGQLGVAVTTCALAVGRAAPWARAGVGAVATQALSQRGYGPRLLDRLAAGDAAEAALDQLLATDEDADQRQVGVVGAAGAPAAWTGVGCLSACGHRTGADSSAQGNMLASRSVIPSVAEGYADAPGDLAARLVAALRAGDTAGGDLRGRQSAALIVVSGQQGRRGALGGRAGGPAGRRRRRPGRRAGAAAAAAARVRDRATTSCSRRRRRRGYGSCTARWPRPPAATGRAPGTRCARCGSAPAGRAGCAGCGSTAGCRPPRSSSATDRATARCRRAAWRSGCRAE